MDPATGKRRKRAAVRVDKVLEALVDDGIDEKKIKNQTFNIVALAWLEVYQRSGVTG